VLEHVHWLGHAGIKITGEKVIYVDPYAIGGGEKADLIMVTHDHYDHLSMADIEKIRGRDTILIVPASADVHYSGPVREVHPGDSLTVENVTVRVIPSYNLNKPFHPRSRNNVGYLFTTGDRTYYHAGDTDRIPEMKEIRADVAFLPVGGTYTMNPAEAAGAAEDVHCSIAVPIHWGSVVGSRRDAETFEALCPCEVAVLEPETA